VRVLYGPKIADGGGHDQEVMGGEFGQHGIVHLLGGFDIDASGVGQGHLDGAEDGGDLMAG
jgi:hypothetical protein